MNNVAWLESKIKQASEEGNFQDWENYTKMLEQWEVTLDNCKNKNKQEG